MFNEFRIIVTQSHHLRHIFDIVREGYFTVDFFHVTVDLDIIESRNIRLPVHMLKYVRNWELSIAPETGVMESDIVPTEPKYVGYKYLLDALEEACKFLSRCQQIHQLRVKIRVKAPRPFSTELVLGPILKLRNIRKTYFDVGSTDEFFWDRYWQAWRLKHSCGLYMSRIMALPEGTAADEYNNGDEDDDEKRWKGLFEYIEYDLPEDDSSISSLDSVYRTMTATWVMAMNKIGGSRLSSESSSDASGALQEDNVLAIHSNETNGQEGFNM
jgi:hypothetical protein